MAPTTKTVLLCGGGNAVHVMAALASGAGHRVRILSTFADEAARLANSASERGITAKCDDGREVTGFLEKVAKDPAEVAPGCDVVVLAVPAFAHEAYLKAIAPFVDANVTVGAFPGQGGFDTCVRSTLKAPGVVFAGETLPWACRIVDFGKRVEILGTKKEVDVAVSPAAESATTLATLQSFFGEEPRLVPVGSFLSITLMNINMIWHPTISYGQYRDWDGQSTFQTPPPFYEGVDRVTGDLLSAVSDEMLRVKAVVRARYPDVDLSGVVHVKDWICRAYGDDIADKSSLAAAINTNKGYRGLTHPCVKQPDGTFLPDFSYRYFTEDVPFGLLVAKGVAELAKVQTPAIDKVLDWCQRKLGKTFLLASKDNGLTLQGAPDVGASRAPQRYGFTDLHAYMLAHKYVVDDSPSE